MQLNMKAFALAASIMAALSFTICAILVAIVPQLATAVLSDVVHLDLSGLSRSLTWSNYIVGLLFWTVLTGVVFGSVVQMYNALIRNGSARIATR